jgi:hypothetical protein
MCVAVPVCLPVYRSAVCTSAICLCVHRRQCLCLCLCLCLSVCAEGHDDVITAIVPVCLSLSLLLGPSLCVCVRRPHPDSEGGLCLWPRGHSLDRNNIDAALLQQIQAFMRRPAATRQAEGTRPPSSHRQCQRRWLLQYRPVCVWGTAYVCSCCSLWLSTHVSVCMCVCRPPCASDPCGTHILEHVYALPMCVCLMDAYVSGVSISSCAYLLA